jgi:hypothetical protein
MKYGFIRLIGVSSRQSRVIVKKRDVFALAKEDVLHRKSIETEK